MKIATTFSIIALATLTGATAHAEPKEQRGRDLDCGSRASTPSAGEAASLACTPAGRHEQRPADTVTSDGEKRLSSERLESQIVVDQLESKYGQSSWYEDASDAELESAFESARALLSRLSAISVDLGEGAIANQASVLDGIRDTVAGERQCRSDKICLAERAAKKSEAEFVVKVVSPLCDADNVLESARADVSHERSNTFGATDQSLLRADRDEIQNAERTIKALMANYAKVRHHAFKGWRSECQTPRDGASLVQATQGARGR